ncbi:MAG: glycosyl transferase family 1 [Kordia sp.]|nr:MAG: glycosyl transferase family 1 [Kordia sp.]
MHICFISSEFPLPGASFGGIGTFLLSYSKILIEKGHRVTIIGLCEEDKEIKKPINDVLVYYKKRSNVKGFSWFFNSRNISKSIAEVHRNNKIDIIEAQEGGFAFVKIARDIKKVIRMHGGHHFFHKFENKKLNKKKALLEKLSFTKSDAIIATSDFVKKVTSKYINFNDKRQATINNPILMDMFYPADTNKVKKGAVVFAGTICEKKGIRQLCLAIPQIVKEFPEFHLYAYGREWNFPDGRQYKDWMLSQLSDEIKSHITFRAPVSYDKLPMVYEFAEICVFPSHMEVQGLVAPEAMSMRKTVIFTQYGPGPETIDDGINGFLCKPLEVDSIAETVVKVFKLRNKHEEIGKRAREKVREKFSPKSIYSKNITFYKSLI